MYFITLCPSGFSAFVNNQHVKRFLMCMYSMLGDSYQYSDSLNTVLYHQLVGICELGNYIHTESGNSGFLVCLDDDEKVRLDDFALSLKDMKRICADKLEVNIILPDWYNKDSKEIRNIIEREASTIDFNMAIVTKSIDMFESECGLDGVIN